MKQGKRFLALVLSIAMLVSMLSTVNVFAEQGSETAIVNLKTEDKQDPIGIDAASPSFSWQMQSAVLGQKQTAYQLVVARDSALNDVVWRSEKEVSGLSAGIRYEGEALAPSTVYYWAVTVWDKDQTPVQSPAASFETGLFGNSGWNQSEWIQVGTSTAEPEPTLPLNYTLEADFQITNGGVALVFEAADASNLLMWQFASNKDGTLHFRPHTKKGGYALVKDIDVTQFAADGSMGEQHLMVAVTPDQVKTYLNGMLIDTTEASRLNGVGLGEKIGNFGFRSTDKNQETGWFDNFVLTDYSANPDGEVAFRYNLDDGVNPFDNGAVVDGKLDTSNPGSGEIIGLRPTAPPVTEDVRYVVEAEITSQQTAASVIFNATDKDNFYMWQFNTADQPGKVLFKPHTWKGGAYATYSGHTKDVSELVGGVEGFANTPARLKIVVTGEKIETYLNDTLFDTFSIGEKSNQGTSGITPQVGYLGVRSSGDESSTVDNFKLTDFSSSSDGEVVYDYTFDRPADNPFLGGTIENGVFIVQGVGILLPPVGVPTFRKEFTPANEVVKARLYTTALGIYDAYLNGERVGAPQPDGSVVYDELKPGYTSGNKRLLYYTYDVTPFIRDGVNTLSAFVTAGWWNGDICHYGNTNAFRAQLLLTYADGSTEVVGTDRSWKTAYAGPMVSADIYQGEVYDGRMDAAYRKSGFNDTAWKYADLNTEFRGELTAQSGPTARVREDLALSTQSVTVYDGATGETEDQWGKINVVAQYGDEAFTLEPGQKAVFDLGQNFAGWDNLQLEGAKGTVVTMRHAEILNDNDGLKSRGNDGPEGSVYTENLRTAAARGVYVLGGNGVESYHSSHTYYGFRYLEVSATQPVKIHGLDGIVVTSVALDTGSIETSNSDVNQLFSNVKWGQYSNYLSVPTDCPQRNERQGWTADTQVFSTAGSYNADAKGFLMKWMQDMRDDQGSNGAYPDTAPGGGYMGQLGWADAGIIVPYNLYKMYGDAAVLEENYDSMQKYVDVFLASCGKMGAGKSYGDWLAYEDNDKELKDLLGVAYYAWDAQMMAEIAQVLGRPEDVEKYNQLYQQEKDFFIETFVNSDGSLTIDKQTACLMALKMDLLPNKESWNTVKQMLLDNITRNGDKLQTGFLGTSVIMQTLSDIGATDVAYKLLLQRGNPSWLYSIDQGATTIWERWNSYTKESGFGDNGMNSFNHYAYGAVAEWMYGYMAGILYDFDQPGFKHVILRPSPDPVLGFVNASYDSAYGAIRSGWKYEDGKFLYSATVPANATATIELPVEEGKQVIANGKPAQEVGEADGLTYLGVEDGRAVFEAVAGSYSFSTEVSDTCFVTITNADERIAGKVSINGADPRPLPATVKTIVGKPITVEAAPVNDVDYRFSSWTGEVSSSAHTLTITPQQDMSVAANFTWCGYDSLALNKAVTSNAGWTVSDWAPAHLVDGILTSEQGSLGFTSTTSGSPDVDIWVQIDLGADTEFNRIQLYPRSDLHSSSGKTASFPTDFSIEVRAEDEEGFTAIGTYADYQAPLGKPAAFAWEEGCTARYVRLHVTRVGDRPAGEGSYYLQLAELGIYNIASIDKSILERVLSYAGEALEGSEYAGAIQSVQMSFKATLAYAQTVYDNPYATQDEIDAAWIALMNQIHRLGFQKGEVEQLLLLIDHAKTLRLDSYVEAGQAAFLDALEAAKKVAADGDAFQGEVDEAMGKLIDAMVALRLKADKSLLNETILKTDAIDTAAYTPASVDALRSAKEAAQKLADDPTLTDLDQPLIDRAANDLRQAIDGLEPLPIAGDAALTGSNRSPRTGDAAPVSAAASALLLAAGWLVVQRRVKRSKKRR